MTDDSENSLFDKLGLDVQYGEVVVGQTYPIYGSITKFLCDEPGKVVINVNGNVEMSLSVEDLDKIEILKSRTFEPGIFVCLVKEIGDIIKCDCSTVIFGKKNTEYEQ